MNGSRAGSSFIDRILHTPVTWLIVALNIGLFVLAWIRDGAQGLALDIETLRAFGASSRWLVQHGDPWRLLTAVFLHANWLHLGVNTFFMVGWCAAVEKSAGSLWFAFAYLTTGIGGFAASALTGPYLSVGASGAGFGVVAVVLSLLYRREGSWDRFISNPGVRQTLIWGGGWILVGFLFIRGLDNSAHLGGFALGVPCGLVLGGRQGRRRPAWLASLAAYILVWLGIVVLACIPGGGFRQGG